MTTVMKTPASETKVCTKCGEARPIEQYGFLKLRNKFNNKCNPCVAILASINYRKRKGPTKAMVQKVAREWCKERGLKFCCKCELAKKPEDFINKQRYCRPCSAKYEREVRGRRIRKLSEKQLENIKNYRAYHKNLPHVKAYTRARRAFIRDRKRKTLLSKTHRTTLTQIYRDCPENWHVDHIVPLSHPLVSGLHVPWNLQYLPASENISKSNKLPSKEQWLAYAEKKD